MDVVKPRPVQPADAFTLPARYYTDPSLFHREIERIFATMWVCAGRADQIPAPGDYFVREIGGESVIVTRDRSGAIGGFFNVCRHRGTRLCAEASGHFTETIQCPYHAWTYGLDGRLVAAPHMDDVPHFRRDEYPLNRVALEEWDGHIFLNLAEAPRQRLHEQLADLPTRFEPWRMEELRLGVRITYDVHANWKLIIQNYSECLHCPVIHPRLQKQSHYLSGENVPAHEAYLGGAMDLRPGIETFSADGSRPRACFAGLSEADRSRVYFYAILPNFLLSLHPDYMMAQTLWPRACDRTEIVSEWHFHPDELARPGFSADDVIEFWDETNKQDWHVSEQAQLGIGSRAYRPGPYSNREDLLYAFDRWVVGMVGDEGAEGHGSRER